MVLERLADESIESVEPVVIVEQACRRRRVEENVRKVVPKSHFVDNFVSLKHQRISSKK